MVGGDTTSLRLATLIQMTVPGAPSIYYGDEIGMTGELDPLNRGAFPWDQPETLGPRPARRRSAGPTALRHAQPVLRHGSFAVVAADGPARRLSSAGSATRGAIVAVNAGDGPQPGRVDLPDQDGRTFVVAALAGRPGRAWPPTP